MQENDCLRLFGGVRLCSGFPALLFARLVLAGDAGCQRESLTEAFWPGEDTALARPRLRQALLTLRRALERSGFPPEALIADRNAIRLDTRIVPTDVAAFERAIRAGDWARAEPLYGGDLLPGVDDDPIITSERARLRLAYQNVLRHLSEASEAQGDLVRAVDYAARLAALDPLDEDYALRKIRLLIAAGHRDTARKHYRQLRRAWQTQKGEPFPEPLRDRVRKWLAATAAASSPAESAPPAEAAMPGRPSDRLVATLPLPLTRFFGREGGIDSVLTLLREENRRLVTLVGPGGAGKTRLAIEIASRLAAGPAMQGGETATTAAEAAGDAERSWDVCFAGLADIADAALLGDVLIRAALRVARDPRVTPLEQAVQSFRERARPVLLVLDNAEHLLEQDGLRTALRMLLAGAPRLACLVTSRQPLEVSGEREVPVDPLPVPPPTAENLPERLLEYAGTALFLDRVRAVYPDFPLTAQNAGAFATLCRRLDGLPLALEIAATWARTLTPAQMLDQMERAERRRALLVSRRPRGVDAPRRHASLQAAIEWSFRPLPPDLQRFFTRLHVFRGGFTEEAAAAICDEPRAMEFLAALQERSLVLGGADHTADDHASEAASALPPRFRLLETLREYGRDQVSEGERSELSRRHAEYFAGFAERAEPEMLRPDQARWGALLDAETDNLRAALEWSLSPGGDPSVGLRQAGARWRSWPLFVRLDEARGYLERLLAALPAPQNAASGSDHAVRGQTKAVFAVGVVAYYQGDAAEGMRRAEECRRLPHLPEDAWIVAFNQCWLGVMRFYGGQFAAAEGELAQGLQQSRAVGDDWLVGYALAFNGFHALCRGEIALVPGYCEESLTLAARVGEKWLTALNHIVLGQYHFYAHGDAARANALTEDGLHRFRSLNDTWCVSFGQSLLGFLLERQGHSDEALRQHQENLRVSETAGARLHIACSLEGIAEAACTREHHELAAALWGAADALHEEAGIPAWPFLHPFRQAAEARAQAALGAAAFAAAHHQGRTTTGSGAIQSALAFR